MKILSRLAVSAALFVGVLAGLTVILAYSGWYDVAATDGHIAPLAQLMRIMKMRSVVVHARRVHPPAGFDPRRPALVELGAGHYEAMCRSCHGAPGRKPESGHLYPPAPDLADALRVVRWSDAEVYWIIKNGIKDTGMAAFGSSADDDELWALTAFVRQMRTLTREQYHAMIEHAPMHEHSGQDHSQESSETPTPHHH